MTGGNRPPGGPGRPSGPGDGSDDMDRRFSEIVAHLQDPPRGTEPGPESVESASAAEGPPVEDLPPSERPPTADPAPQGHPPAADGSPPSVRPPAASGGAAQWRQWEGPEGADPADDHFVPPEPPPLPAGDLHFWAILVGLTLGPLILLLSTVVPLLDGPVWGVLGVVLSVGGFVLLVLRSPDGGDDDWGARV